MSGYKQNTGEIEINIRKKQIELLEMELSKVMVKYT